MKLVYNILSLQKKETDKLIKILRKCKKLDNLLNILEKYKLSKKNVILI